MNLANLFYQITNTSPRSRLRLSLHYILLPIFFARTFSSFTARISMNNERFRVYTRKKIKTNRRSCNRESYGLRCTYRIYYSKHFVFVHRTSGWLLFSFIFCPFWLIVERPSQRSVLKCERKRPICNIINWYRNHIYFLRAYQSFRKCKNSRALGIYAVDLQYDG